MEVCKNKASEKYFLLIEETDDGKLLLVIPNGEVKELDPPLFEDIEELDIDYCLNSGFASRQIDGYKKFIEEDSIRMLKNAMKSGNNLLDQLDIARESMSSKQWEFVMQKLENLAPELGKVEDTKNT